MSESAFIGIDLGTSGCRVPVIDESQNPLFETSRPLPSSRRGSNGESEQDPMAWWQAIEALLRTGR